MRKFLYKNPSGRLFTNTIFVFIAIFLFSAASLLYSPPSKKTYEYKNNRSSKVTKYLEKSIKGNSSIVINEIMFHPKGNNADEEYVEIYNRTSKNISLREWRIKGINFIFPPDTVIKAHDYVVAAANPYFIIRNYMLKRDKVVGTFRGSLSNSGERIQLLRPDGGVEDEVFYCDGNNWDIAADGKGPSLELINPALDNTYADSWGASNAGDRKTEHYGTPGRVNSIFQKDVNTIIKSASYSPAVPKSKNKILFVCELWRPEFTIKTSDSPSTISVRLNYRTRQDEAFKGVMMGRRNQTNEYFVFLSPFENKSIVEFYFQAFSPEGITMQTPADGANSPYVLQVDDSSDTESLPTYRIVMSAKNLDVLKNRELKSNDLLPATFIAENKVWLNAKMRYRGDSSREHWKKSYRIEFPENEAFNNRSNLLLNGKYWENQYIGSYLFRRAGLPAPEINLARLRLNGEDEQIYATVEGIDKDFVDRVFTGFAGGNLYRGIEKSNLDYRGENKDKYKGSYDKITNKDEDDFSDLIELCKTFSEASEDNYIQSLSKIIDLDEWITYFACCYASANLEGIAFYPDADDYFLYKRPSDGKFVIIPWDFDSVMLHPMVDFRPTKVTRNVVRFLNHPDVITRLYEKIFTLSKDFFSPGRLEELISPLKPYLDKEQNYPPALYSQLLKKFNTHASVIKELLPEKLTAEITTKYSKEIIPPGSDWEYLIGWNEPPKDWMSIDYSKGFFISNAGFGCNWKNLNAFMDFNDYNSVYLKKNFSISPPLSEIEKLRFYMDYSNGFVLYLNGKEILRRFAGEEGKTLSNKDYSNVFKRLSNTEVFDLENYKSLLKEGGNTIAIEAHVLSNEQPYYAFHPWLICGGYEPYRVIIGKPNQISIGGSLPALDTEKVFVNKEEAQTDRVKCKWNFFTTLKDGWNLFSIESYNKFGENKETKALKIYYSKKAGEISGEIPQNTTLKKADSPYLITKDLIVPKGGTLTIEPGAVLVFAEFSALRVYGKITATGASEERITFTPLDKIAGWDGIAIKSSNEDNILRFCDVENAWGREGLSQGNVACHSSRLLLEDCNIIGAMNAGIDINNSNITVRRCRISDIRANYSGDGIKARGKGDKYSTSIEACLIENLNGDGIDLGDSDAKIAQTIIRNCEDKGISMDQRSEPIIDKVSISGTNIGIGAKDVKLKASNVVIFGCSEGLRLNYDLASIAPEVKLSNSIIWNCATSVIGYKASSLDITYCSIQNPGEISGKGVISVDPLFVNPMADNFRLNTESPLLKSGENGNPLIDISWMTNNKWF